MHCAIVVNIQMCFFQLPSLQFNGKCCCPSPHQILLLHCFRRGGDVIMYINLINMSPYKIRNSKEGQKR
uniref:AlNc14C76G5109 protein n=1 Tax=Albugo laibachii Nc14 TaxID=890382 RepID=F0WEQ9_9STRA|nr:AlNc14C76G5109 [Albugo laibachii Nc14]|eukprot:CCA19691.1 AlNc14C76G5109 [Albugo laibachii Nc14]